MLLQSRFKVLLIAVAALAIVSGLAFAHTPARAPAGPYESALTHPNGAAVPMAAQPKCNGRICEFVAPGFHCLFEGGKSSCKTSTSGCTDVACH